MDQPMIADFQQKLADIFDQVSPPLYHNGEGPFFMATREQTNDVKFFFYEANNVETFLADPEKMPTAFTQASTAFKLTNDRTAMCAGMMAELGVACGPSVPMAGAAKEAGTFTCNNASAASSRPKRPSPIVAAS